MRHTITTTVIAFAVYVATATTAHTSNNEFCFEEAGSMYDISPNLLWAIAKHESGFNPTAVNWNKNGTMDYGLLQVNSVWAGVLGTERWMNLSDPCENLKTGAWILRQCINKAGYNWKALGCYNTGSINKGHAYILKIAQILQKYNLLAPQ